MTLDASFRRGNNSGARARNGVKHLIWRRIHCATDYYSAFSIFRTCIVLSSRSAMSGESSVGVEVESREGMDVSPCMGKDVSPLVGLGVEARDGEEDWHVEEQPAMAVLRDGEEKRHVGLGEDVALGVQPRVCLGEDESKGMEEAISEQLVFVQDSDEVQESMCMDDPSSKQEMAVQDSDEVQFVMDSLASDTVVLD